MWPSYVGVVSGGELCGSCELRGSGELWRVTWEW
jgi:hypothetical protein